MPTVGCPFNSGLWLNAAPAGPFNLIMQASRDATRLLAQGRRVGYRDRLAASPTFRRLSLSLRVASQGESECLEARKVVRKRVEARRLVQMLVLQQELAGRRLGLFDWLTLLPGSRLSGTRYSGWLRPG